MGLLTPKCHWCECKLFVRNVITFRMWIAPRKYLFCCESCGYNNKQNEWKMEEIG
jgi:hypothetical protein